MTQYECPCCKGTKYVEINLHSDGFIEDLFECADCSSKWIFKHNGIEVINDAYTNSFIAQDEQCTDGTIVNFV